MFSSVSLPSKSSLMIWGNQLKSGFSAERDQVRFAEGKNGSFCCGSERRTRTDNHIFTSAIATRDRQSSGKYKNLNFFWYRCNLYVSKKYEENFRSQFIFNGTLCCRLYQSFSSIQATKQNQTPVTNPFRSIEIK